MPAGRPLSLTQDRIDTAKDILDKDPDFVYIFTDEELIDEINDTLINNGLSDKIFSHDTYKRMKKEAQSENRGNYEDKLGGLFYEFCTVIKKALRHQKVGLVRDMKQEEKARQRYAWILERKWSETWNKVNKNEHSGPDGSDLFKNISIIDATKDE